MPAAPILALDRTHLPPGLRLCAALSGGADSVALLRALHEANTPTPANKHPLGLVLSAVHVHHGLRGNAADADETFVRDLCTALHVPLHVFHVDTPARQAAHAEGLEEAARELRYDAFRSLLRSYAADAIATAHTLDDQAETLIMKLLRGAWTEGLAGISPVVQADPGRIFRPLLAVSRAEIEAFLHSRNQAWSDDATNQDLNLTRNRIRHQLMPLLRSFNPRLDALLGRTAEIARDEESFWQAEVARVLPQLLLPGKPVRGGGRSVATTPDTASCALELERLKPLAPALRRRLLRAAARTLGVRLSSEETAKLLALAGFSAHPTVTARIGSRLELHAGLRAERSARELRLSRGNVTSEP